MTRGLMILRTGFAAAAFSVAVIPAFAADFSYPAAAPPSGSPLYAATSLITGDVALGVGAFDNGDDTLFEVVGSGRVNFPLWGGWNEELELAGLAEEDYSAVGLFSHTYWKDPTWAAGFVIGASGLDGDGVVTAGIEGAGFGPAHRVVGALTYNWADHIDDFWTASAQGDWYLNPNSKVGGKVAYFTGGGDGWMLTALAEHRFTGTMFGVFGSGSWFTFDNGPDSWELLAGGRIYFDGPGGTLQQYDWSTPFATARDISF